MNRLATILLIAVALLFIGLAGRLNSRLLELRREYRLNQGDPLENSPPLVAFTTVALGGFRGILADILWMRAAALQREGDYLELVQLSDWITKLEPRFPAVWTFQAWNLSYNVSVFFERPEERWRWVRHGIGLLRDEGLLYNPGSAPLYQELGWLFQNKVGGYLDTASVYYQQAWAGEMADLFAGANPGRDPLSPESRRRMKEAYKLDPDTVQRIDRDVGPLDWRLAQTHAIYWALQGLPFAAPAQKIMLERMIFQSLAASVRAGTLSIVPGEDLWLVDPAPGLIEPARNAYDAAIRNHPDDATLPVGRFHFLQQAVLVLSLMDRRDEANAWLARIRELYPSHPVAGNADQLVRQVASDAMQGVAPARAQTMITDELTQSCLRRAVGLDEPARFHERWARRMYQAVPAGQFPPFEELFDLAREKALESIRQSTNRERLAGLRPLEP